MSLIDNKQEEKNIEYYQTPGSIRYITFIQDSGESLSLPYSLLPIIEFEPADESNVITITFPSHTIKLTGYRLEKLCRDLENEKVRSIKASNDRYANIEGNSKEAVVNVIQII